jgi:hypothetical protein
LTLSVVRAAVVLLSRVTPRAVSPPLVSLAPGRRLRAFPDAGTSNPRRSPMDRMEHIQGKIVDGEQVVLDQLDGYLGCHEVVKGRKTYYGYFELPTEQLSGLHHETRYRLVLKDGRAADIFTEVVASNKPGLSLAEFHVSGALKK